MKLFASFGVALATLRQYRGRSLLTTLGIVIGVGSVVASVSAGTGGQQKLEERLGTIGKNMILIRAGSQTDFGTVADQTQLKRDDAVALRRQTGDLVKAVAEVQLLQRTAVNRNGSWPTLVTGTVGDFWGIREWSLAGGRFFTDEDLKKRAAVCVIGETVRRKLFSNQPTAVGEMIQVEQLPLRVIGVLQAKGRFPTGMDQDDEIFVPLTTLQDKLAGGSNIQLILASARTEDDLDAAQQAITRVLRERRKAQVGSSDSFNVSSVQEMAELGYLATATLRLLVGLIASISLLVGGIGIMNMMLATVTERTREIGVRMALGATGIDIMLQFVLEAVVLAVFGGVLGISLGLAAALGISWAANWPLVVSPGTITVAFLVSVAVGVFFGGYPAWKASRLDPITALRCE
jgi:putative ABC transport system permease protein